MFMRNLASLLALVSVSSMMIASTFAFDPKFFEDAPAMKMLLRVYGGNESAIPEALKKSIGSCKFTTHRLSQPTKFDGTVTGYILISGTSNPKDTCLFFQRN